MTATKRNRETSSDEEIRKRGLAGHRSGYDRSNDPKQEVEYTEKQ